MILDVRQPQALVGQLGFRLGAHLFELLDAPLKDLFFRLRVLLDFLRGFGFGLTHRLHLAVTCKGVQQHQQGTQGADHGIQK